MRGGLDKLGPYLSIRVVGSLCRLMHLIREKRGKEMLFKEDLTPRRIKKGRSFIRAKPPSYVGQLSRICSSAINLQLGMRRGIQRNRPREELKGGGAHLRRMILRRPTQQNFLPAHQSNLSLNHTLQFKLCTHSPLLLFFNWNTWPFREAPFFQNG